MENKTNFGFKIIDSINKSNLVQAIFSAVAPKYDLMNDFMSAGIHRLWKNTMVSQLNFTQHKKILDLASGTGDIALKITKQAHRHCPFSVISSPGVSYVLRPEALGKGLTWREVIKGIAKFNSIQIDRYPTNQVGTCDNCCHLGPPVSQGEIVK